MATPDLIITTYNPRQKWALRLIWGCLWAGSLTAAWIIATQRAAPLYEQTKQSLYAIQNQAQTLEQQLQQEQKHNVLLKRSEQMAIATNQELQQTLKQQEETLSSLQTDLSFYQRLSGGKSAKQGLTAYDFHLTPLGDSDGYAYTLTLLQNLKKSSVSTGTVNISMSGVFNNQLKKLTWGELQQKKRCGITYL